MKARMKSKLKSKPSIDQATHRLYADPALENLERALDQNAPVIQELSDRLVRDVKGGKSLFVFGSGHSAILPLELYHRAGGASFVIPLVADFLMPQAGPPVVRIMERTAGSANFLLDRAEPRRGEMIWIVSQSGINCAGVDLAIEAKRRGLFTVAFTSIKHSSAVKSRHPSKKRLFEICDRVVDLSGEVGDAVVPVTGTLKVGPVSTLTSIFLAHSILSVVTARLERMRVPCVYTSVNTPSGEKRNKALEKKASRRDPLLR